MTDSLFSQHSRSEIFRTVKEEPKKLRNFRVQSRAVELNTMCE